MPTPTASQSIRDRYPQYLVREGWPWAALAAWLAGAVGIWYYGRSSGWAPGEFVLAGCVWLIVLGACGWPVFRGLFGPVFWYEIVRLGRRRLTFSLRLVYVLAVMALLLLMYLDWLDDIGYLGPYSRVDRVPSERLNQFATEFFGIFMIVQYAVVAFLTPAYVAGTVADEKERKTLEFLLATDLRNHEIIFGKLAARVTNLLMYVMAGLPVVAFMQLFGGIDPDLLLAGTAATVVTVLGLAAVSVYFSTHLKKPRDAIALSYLAVAAYFAGSGILAGYVRFGLIPTVASSGGLGQSDLGIGVIDWDRVLDWVADAIDWLAAGNAPYVYISTMFATRGGGFNVAAVADMLFRYGVFWAIAAGVLLLVSTLRLRTIALRQAYGGVRTTVTRSGAVRQRTKPRPDVGNDPMLWKEVFVEGGVRGGCLGWLLSIIILGLVFFFPFIIAWSVWGDLIPYSDQIFGHGIHSNRSVAERWEDFESGMNIWCRIATGVLGFLVMMAAAVRGAGVVSGERDRDTWVSLISTPLSAWEMVRGKWLGTVLGLRRAYAIILIVWALGLLFGGVDPPMILLSAVYLAVYVSAFAWIGILCSVTARTTLVATLRALMVGFFLVGGFWLMILLCCTLPLSILTSGSGPGEAELIDGAAFFLMGLTPPFVIGWLPLNGYERRDLGPFSFEEPGLGPINPVAGFFVWFALNWILGVLTWNAFRQASNRTRDTLAEQLPRRRSPRVNRGDNWLPKRKPVPPGRGTPIPEREPDPEQRPPESG